MGKLIYSLNISLDGFVETRQHGLDWATVDDERGVLALAHQHPAGAVRRSPRPPSLRMTRRAVLISRP